MHEGKLVFSQIMDHAPEHDLRRYIRRYDGDKYAKSFTCQDQFRAMAFGQLTYRNSLRDTVNCLNARRDRHYHMGFRAHLARSTIADANEKRNWRIYADFAHALIKIARPLYANEDLGLDLDNTIYALDASTIDLCLSVFPWALFRKTKSAIKLHTLLDLRGNIPTFMHISDGKMADVNVLDILVPEAGAFYIMDRGYIDFARLYAMHLAGAFFVIRAKKNTRFKRRYSRDVDKNGGVRCDQTIVLDGINSPNDYPQVLRRIKYFDDETGMTFNFLTNNFKVQAQIIADLYRYRWQVELFFKWIKQHLRIKSFFGTSKNAVKTQMWIAISVYVLIAVIKKRLDLPTDLYTILQILSVTIFEKTPLDQLLANTDSKTPHSTNDNQLNLFGY